MKHAAAGLLLLTGGSGRRFGAPKHRQPHPGGGTWGSHLVDVFQSVFPRGPVQLLGDGLPDRPDLPALEDPKAGPALALCHWARLCQAPPPRRWWVVGCDQIRWTPETLWAWYGTAAMADPVANHWVIARHGERIQPLGGFLASDLVEQMPHTRGTSLLTLMEAIPCLVLESEGEQWLDVDTQEDLAIYLAGDARTRVLRYAEEGETPQSQLFKS